MMMVELALRLTNAEIIQNMRTMKDARDNGEVNILCCISGFDDDERALWEIPESRAL